MSCYCLYLCLAFKIIRRDHVFPDVDGRCVRPVVEHFRDASVQKKKEKKTTTLILVEANVLLVSVKEVSSNAVTAGADANTKCC